MAHSMYKYAILQLKKLESTTNQGLYIYYHHGNKRIKEIKAEARPLTKLIKEMIEFSLSESQG